MRLTESEKIRLLSGRGGWHTDSAGGKLSPIHLSDGPAGLRSQEDGAKNNESRPAVCYPSESALACSFDENLLETIGEALGAEAEEQGVQVLLGPGVNIKRSPLCGRNFEYFSEDPLLSGKLAAAYIRGVQKNGTGCSLKHFAGNNQETFRMTSDSVIDERTLREIYLPASEIAVKEAHPATIMASYNLLNGTHACENRRLLTDILRKEWGYEGMVISDWGACSDLTASIRAGMDLEMPDSLGVHAEKLQKNLAEGRISQEQIDKAANRVCSLIEHCSHQEKHIEPIDYHHVAVNAAQQSAVLLKNAGILPLQKNTRVLVIGGMAESLRIQGGGSGHVNALNVIDLFSAMKKEGISVSSETGYEAETDRCSAELEQAAVKAAEQADVILFAGGLPERMEGEAFDRTSFEMPENQKHLIDLLMNLNKPMVLLSFSGSPYAVYRTEQWNAILQMYLAGEGCAEAAAGLLSGRVSPSGRLAETWPLKLEDTPAAGNFARKEHQIFYRERMLVGYRHYLCRKIPVLFPFGAGLGYSDTCFSDLKILKISSAEIRISVKVHNLGKYEQRETVQVYVKKPERENLMDAPEVLGAFAKTLLKPGEQKEVTAAVPKRAFAVYDTEQRRFVIPSGTYQICIGRNCQDLVLAESVSFAEEDGEIPVRDSVKDEMVYLDAKGKNYDPEKKGKRKYSVSDSFADLSKHSLLAKVLLWIAGKEIPKLYPGRSPDDPEIRMTMETMRDGTADMVSLQSEGMIPYRLVKACVDSANGHKGKGFIDLFHKEADERSRSHE